MSREASSGEHPELTSLHLFEQQAAARDFYDEFVNREEGEGLAQSDSKPLIQLQIHTTERPQPLREMTSDKVRSQINRRYFLGLLSAQNVVHIRGGITRWC